MPVNSRLLRKHWHSLCQSFQLRCDTARSRSLRHNGTFLTLPCYFHPTAAAHLTSTHARKSCPALIFVGVRNPASQPTAHDVTAQPHRPASPPCLTALPHRPASPPCLTALPHRAASPPCLTALPHRPASPPCLTALPYRAALPRCLTALPYRAALPRCLTALPYRAALPRCLTARPYRAALPRCLTALPYRATLPRGLTARPYRAAFTARPHPLPHRVTYADQRAREQCRNRARRLRLVKLDDSAGTFPTLQRRAATNTLARGDSTCCAPSCAN